MKVALRWKPFLLWILFGALLAVCTSFLYGAVTAPFEWGFSDDLKSTLRTATTGGIWYLGFGLSFLAMGLPLLVGVQVVWALVAYRVPEVETTKWRMVTWLTFISFLVAVPVSLLFFGVQGIPYFTLGLLAYFVLPRVLAPGLGPGVFAVKR